ncbi:OmpA family protein [Sphingorhabdus soli]|uniref:OmpA family protein n=1 Tax=Flavisphingopyxis soli TaxID=2601267 RepID=A0A5C6U6Z5_9SPHN|nr:flagellar motor protein MotB [Sphingorhabdus soli]TXC68783.1 OmpA family protein [Sphingorhabdus soli]
MASKSSGSNQRPIIIKKIIADDHSAHHGGAWKVAYADFVTAMMAFFLLMWLLGSTDEKDKKAIADYFTPTLVEIRQDGSAGSNSGPFGGDSMISKDNFAHSASQVGERAITVPKDAWGSKDGANKPTPEEEDEAFKQIEKKIRERLKRREQLRNLAENIRFFRSDEGLRIEVVDAADFAMFELSSDKLVPRAQLLLREVAESIVPLTNGIAVRGHTDSLPYASGKTMNNWLLSAARAEATRQALISGGLTEAQFDKIEGVADRQPYSPDDAADPRNRRMSITLLSEARGSTASNAKTH